MAGFSKKGMLLGAVLAAFVAAAACTGTLAAPAEATVTIYNPANLVAEVLVDGDTSLKLAKYVTTLSLRGERQGQLKITTDEGHVVEVLVQDGDALVIVPDLDGDGSLVFKVQNGIRASPLPLLPAFPQSP